MESKHDLRPEYDLSQLKGGIRGKYYRKATASTNLVLIEPELTGKTRQRSKSPSKRLKRSA